MSTRSTIIIARRLSLIKKTDYIAIMEEDQLVEMGTHDELLTLGGLHAEFLRCEEATKLLKRMPADMWPPMTPSCSQLNIDERV